MSNNYEQRSLHVGTNYPGTDAALAGCVNDARAWQAVCEPRGFDTRLLLDGDATRTNILDCMTGLIDEARYGDRVVITYSGHGTWVPDLSGDEPDRRDEAICPTDFRSAGVITDDQLYEVFRSAARGVRVVFVADSCFSGTLQRFAPPITGGEPWGGERRRPRFLPPAAFLDRRALALAEVAERAPAGGRFRRSGLVLSACRDDQVTYDTVIDGQPCGIFTHVALTALEAWQAGTEADDAAGAAPVALTHRQWHRQIRTMLPSLDFPDVTPQLDGTSDQKRWPVFA